MKDYALSANLGYLFTEHPLVDAIARAAEAGFKAVECQRPYHVPAAQVRQACIEAAIPMLAINTAKGEHGQFGLSALPDAIHEARQAIDQAVDYAGEVEAGYIHLVSGITSGSASFDTLCLNIEYALERLKNTKIEVIIEPINTNSVPGYFMSSPQIALDVVTAVNSDRLGIMFDCFHMLHITGSKTALLDAYALLHKKVRHIQFAAFPERNEPNHNPFSYPALFNSFMVSGYDGYFGAEYQPAGSTQASLDWMNEY